MNDDRLTAIRAQIANKNYEDAVRLGRAVLDGGCSSSDLLLLMATAGQLGDGSSCTLDEVRGWLEQATSFSPESPEPWLELGHFLEAVADEPRLAASAFERALEKSVDALAATLDGLDSTSSSHDEEMRGRLRKLRQDAIQRLGS
jgi:hypothetical protein